MNANIKPSEQLAVLDVIPPSAQAAGVATTAWVPAGVALRLMALIQIGALGASATVDAKVQQAKDVAGTGAKDVTGAAIVQHTVGNNKECLINVDPGVVDVEGGFNFVQLSVTVGVATTPTSAVLLAVGERYQPAAQAASVTQTIG